MDAPVFPAPPGRFGEERGSPPLAEGPANCDRLPQPAASYFFFAGACCCAAAVRFVYGFVSWQVRAHEPPVGVCS